MCGGTGSVLGAILGAALAPATFGASLLPGALAGGVAGGAVGAAAGDALIDKPQKQMQDAMASQQTAANQAVAAAEKQATESVKATQSLADQLYNKQNAKAPDAAAMLSANTQAAKGGASSTMLTGPQGVDMSSLNLGKNTLLGA